MSMRPNPDDADTSTFKILLWIWTSIVTLGSGIVAGNSGDDFSFWWFLGGALGGLISTIPLWAIFGALQRIIDNLYHDRMARFEATQVRPSDR